MMRTCLDEDNEKMIRKLVTETSHSGASSSSSPIQLRIKLNCVNGAQPDQGAQLRQRSVSRLLPEIIKNFNLMQVMKNIEHVRIRNLSEDQNLSKGRIYPNTECSEVWIEHTT